MQKKYAGLVLLIVFFVATLAAAPAWAPRLDRMPVIAHGTVYNWQTESGPMTDTVVGPHEIRRVWGKNQKILDISLTSDGNVVKFVWGWTVTDEYAPFYPFFNFTVPMSVGRTWEDGFTSKKTGQAYTARHLVETYESVRLADNKTVVDAFKLTSALTRTSDGAKFTETVWLSPQLGLIKYLSADFKIDRTVVNVAVPSGARVAAR